MRLAKPLFTTALAWLLMGWLSGCATTTQPAQRSPWATHAAYDTPLSEITLDNGLRVYLAHSATERSTLDLHLLVNVGSYHEQAKEAGYAHLIEHLGFRGSSLADTQAFHATLHELGILLGEHSNAFTSREWTRYDLSLSDDSEHAQQQAARLLARWAYGIDFSTHAVRQEKAVLREERRLSDNAAQAPLFRALSGYDHYFNKRPIGHTHSLSQATVQSLKAFYQRWYTPDNMAVLVLAGRNHTLEPLLSQLEQQLGQTLVHQPSPAQPTQAPYRAHLGHCHTQYTDQGLLQSRSGLSWRLPVPSATRVDYTQALAQLAALQLAKQRLVAQGDEATLHQQSLDQHQQILTLDTTQSGTPRDDFRRLLSTLHALKQSLTAAELSSITDTAQHAVLDWPIGPKTPLEALIDSAQRGAISPAWALKQQLPEALRTLRIQDIQRSLDQLLHNTARCWISAQTPDAPALQFTQVEIQTIESQAAAAKAHASAPSQNPKMLNAQAQHTPQRERAQAALRANLQRTIEHTQRNQDQSSTKPAHPLGTPLPALQTTQFTLENGLTVLMVGDVDSVSTVGLALRWPRGRQVLRPEQQQAAEAHATLLLETPVKHWGYSLKEYFASSLSSLHLDYGREAHSALASTHPAGVGSALQGLAQLINGQFAFNDHRLLAFKHQRLEQQQNLEKQPQRHAQRWLTHTVQQTPELSSTQLRQRLEQLNSAKLQQVHQQLFSALADATLLVHSAALHHKALETAIRQHLGTIPNTAKPNPLPTTRSSTAVDAAHSRVQRIEQAGTQARSDVIELYRRENSAPTQTLSEHLSDWTMAKLLRQQLFQSLREQAGWVYRVEVSLINAVPSERVDQLLISYSCAPENQAKVSALIRDNLRRFATRTVREAQLQATKASVIQQLERALKNPALQANLLLKQHRLGQPLQRAQETLAQFKQQAAPMITRRISGFLPLATYHIKQQATHAAEHKTPEPSQEPPAKPADATGTGGVALASTAR